MDAKKLVKAAKPKSLGDFLQKSSGDHVHHGSTARVTTHNGHKIELETIYRVTVDGKKVDLGLVVDDTGNVHCHSLPNYQFQSALDMVKAVVDLFPDDFKKNAKIPPRKHVHKHAVKPKKTAKKGTRGKHS